MISFEKFVIQDDIDKYNMLLECSAEINALEKRIDKAIEYINSEDICIDIRKTDGSMDYVSEEELLEILKGDSNES